MWSWQAFLEFLGNFQILKGAWMTVWLTLVSFTFGLVLAVLVALAGSSRFGWLRGIVKFYVWLMRGTPLLVQLIIIFTGLPQLGIKLSAISAALLGLVLNEAAYMSEIVRAGILSVPKGQREAARGLGMSPFTTLRVVILPQAFRVMIPPLGNSFNGLLKSTSLVSVISVTELLRATQFAVQLNFRVLEGLVVAAVYYLIMTTLWGRVQRKLELLASKGHQPEAASRGAAVKVPDVDPASPTEAIPATTA